MNFLKDTLFGRWLCRDAYEDSLGFGWALISFIIGFSILAICLETVWDVNFS